ncbi:hypothetical protein PVA38_11135 [Streptococcus pneumoniae D39]|nr:hypothetical protein PVA38_11135 [Streptococcus pneumoniae D39]
MTNKSCFQVIFHHENIFDTVSYTHLRAHETVLDLVCRLLLEKKKYFLHTFCVLFFLSPLILFTLLYPSSPQYALCVLSITSMTGVLSKHHRVIVL